MKELKWIETYTGGLINVSYIREIWLEKHNANSYIRVDIGVDGMEVLNQYTHNKTYTGGFPTTYKGAEAAAIDFEIIKNFLIYGVDDSESCIFGRDKYMVEE